MVIRSANRDLCFPNYLKGYLVQKATRKRDMEKVNSSTEIRGSRMMTSQEAGGTYTIRCSCLSPPLNVRAQPLQTLVQTVTAGRASCLDIPSPLPEPVQAQLVRDFCCVHRIGKILLVGEDEKEGVPEFVFVEHSLEFFTCFGDTIAIVGIDDEDDALGVLEVMPPKWPDFILTSDVPDGEVDVLILDRFDIETDGRNGSHDFAQFELVQDCRLTRSVEADHQYPHLLLANQASQQL